MKEKNSNETTNKKCYYIIEIIVLIIGIGIIFLKIPGNIRGTEITKIVTILGLLLVLADITALLCTAYFNGREQFNEDTIKIFGSYGIVEVFLLIISFVFSYGILDNFKDFSQYVHVFPDLFICSVLYFWIIYLKRSIKVINEIKKDKYIFLVKTVKTMLGATLIWASSRKIIGSLDCRTDYIYEFINIFVNLSFPLLGMFTEVRSEIDEFDKQEKEKIAKGNKEKFDKQKEEMDKKEYSEVNETDVLNKETNGKNKEKKQYHDVEEFVDRLGTKKDLNKLENKVDKRRKKLKKEQFSDSKRYVKKFATLEDLDNLKKIIDEKRGELKNNNDVEKHVD